MHKLHNHRFKHTTLSKILMDMHLLMLHLLEKILRKHCMHSAGDNQHSKCSNHGRSKRYSCKVHICSQFSGESFHLNHSKIPKGNTIQVRVALKANTWIKSNQSLLSAMVRLLKNPFLNLVRKTISQSMRVRKGLNLNIVKKRLIPHQYFHFLMSLPNKEKSITTLKSLKLSDR